MIEGKGLTMRFGNNTALDGVDVCFGDNKIYGLLGRNGAGKSTLLSVVTNRLLPTAGEGFIDGGPARENDRVLGRVYYMGEKTLLPDTATVAQLFRWTGGFYPGFDGEYAGQLADTFGLPEKKKLKNLSTGYLTIAKLIAALASNAPYTLFDEPVLGLDANHREVFYRQLIESYSRQPRTILISSRRWRTSLSRWSSSKRGKSCWIGRPRRSSGWGIPYLAGRRRWTPTAPGGTC